GVVDQDAQRDHHTDDGNLVQHTAAKIIDTQADQGDDGQHHGDQQAHAPTHPVEYDDRDDQHADQQALLQAVEPALDLIGLEEQLANLQRRKIGAQQFHPPPHVAAELDRVHL